MILLLPCLFVSFVSAELPTWPSFQNGGNLSIYDSGLELSQRPSLNWSSDLDGYGQSSPVVWGEHVYVTTVEGENKETCLTTAYQLSDGKQLWQQTVKNPTPQPNNNYVSKAAPTPAADEDGLIVLFEGGVVVAYSHAGDVRWTRNLVEDFGPIESRHGLSSSVEQNASMAFVWIERAEDPYVAAVNKQSGEIVWKSAGIGATSWASPRLIPVDGQQHLVLSGIGVIAGLEPETGQRLWALEGVEGNSTPTPIPVGEGRFLIGATVGRSSGDSDSAAASNGVVQISKSDNGQWHADYAWRAEKATSSFGSPLFHNGKAYFVNRSGALFTLAVETGKQLSAGRLGGSIWATPTALSNDVLFFTKEGVVVRCGPDGKCEDWVTVDEARGGEPETLYAGVIVGSQMLIRTGTRLLCYEIASK